jgi:hypothetical protein
MTLFYSQRHELGDRSDASRSSVATTFARLLRRAVGRTSACLTILHQAIVTAKTRRLAHELMLHGGLRDAGSFDPNEDAAKVPRRPLLLGDKWDF